MKILSAFLYVYLHGDILVGDQVTYQLYAAHAVMIYTCGAIWVRTTHRPLMQASSSLHYRTAKIKVYTVPMYIHICSVTVYVHIVIMQCTQCYYAYSHYSTTRCHF